ncbi:MAG TPA: hypothetical protein VE782_11990 [Myxococcaceae bacterium]|nr:hypothetical protein [Myxococcaceae bacterium]
MKPSLDRPFSLFAVAAALALLASACEATPSAAQRRRDLIRDRGNWVKSWQGAKDQPDAVGYRLKLAFDYRANPTIAGTVVADEEIERTAAADARAVAEGTAPKADLQALLLAERWAEEVMGEKSLAARAACRASSLPEASYPIHMRCGELANTVLGDPTTAIRAWQSAYAMASTPDQQCGPVFAVSAVSLAPERDMAGFSSEVISRCRRGGTAPVPSTAEAGAAPRPGGGATGVPPSASPSAIAAGGINPGLEIRADVVQPVALAYNLNLLAPVYLGYGDAQYAIGGSVLFGYSKAAPASGSSLSDYASVIGVVPSARVFFMPRAPQRLNPYARAELSVAAASVGIVSGNVMDTTESVLFGVMGGVGAEYLFTPHVGVTGDFSVRGLFPEETIQISSGASIGLVLRSF